jgi:TolB-like protein
MQYKEKRKPLAAIARELNVDAIIEGGVVKSGGRVTLYVQLVDPATERHLWAANYERNIDQVTTAQSDIARAVANGIRVRLTPQEQARLSRSESVDPEAYESY